MYSHISVDILLSGHAQLKGSTLKVESVQLLDCLLGFLGGLKLDEANAFGLAFLVVEELGSQGVEVLASQEHHDVLLGLVEGDVAHEDDVARFLGVRVVIWDVLRSGRSGVAILNGVPVL